mgnify:CR=1 FL=1
MISSICIYGITFLWSTILFALFQKISSKKCFLAYFILILSVVPPVVIFCLRGYSVGWDTKRYVPIYNHIKGMTLGTYLREQKTDINCRFELGYYFLNRISYLIYDSYRTVMFFSVTIMLLFAYKVFISVKKYRYTYIAVFIYYITVYTQGMDVIRFSIGCSICMLAFLKLINKKNGSFIFYIILASFFQKIFIVFLIYICLIEFKKDKLNKIRDIIYYLCIVLSPIILPLGFGILSRVQSFSYYFNYYQIDYSAGGVGFLKDVIPLIPITYLYYRNVKNYKGVKTLYNISLSTIPLCYLAYFVTSAVRMKRVSYLSWLFLIPIILEHLDHPKYKKVILIYYVIVFLLYYVF